MKDLRNEVQRSDVLKALEIKFNFLKKLYRNTSLIEDLTRGIERKGEKEIVARVRA